MPASDSPDCKPATQPLPALPFTVRRLGGEASVGALREAIELACPTIEDVQVLGPASKFQHNSAIIQLGGSTLAFSSHTPICLRWKQLQRPTIFLPFAGNADFVIAGRKLSVAANVNALLVTEAQLEATTTIYAGLIVTIDRDEMNNTAHAMLGHQHAALSLDADRVIDLQLPNGLRIDHLLTLLFKQIAQLAPEPALMAMLGLEEQLRRLFVILLEDRAGREDRSNASAIKSRKVLDELCDQIDANLSHHMTLTEMEVSSGLSRRTLQYTFHKYFGCSPMQWVRMRRLEAAYDYLIDRNCNETILQIALNSGFSGAGEFSRAFKRHFGMQPSAVRGHSKDL